MTAASPAGMRLRRPPVAAVLQQHVEEAAHLREVRAGLVRAPHAGLLHLGRLDERLLAHLDGISVAGLPGAAWTAQSLDPPRVGSMFAATVGAIESRDAARLAKLLAVARLAPDTLRGVLSAFGWVSSASLRGITKPLLESKDDWSLQVGFASCAMHGVHPGAESLRRGFDAEASPALAAQALRVASATGSVDLRDACTSAARSASETTTRFEATRAALLLGERSTSLALLQHFAATPNELREASLRLVLKGLAVDESFALLRLLNAEPGSNRTLVRAIGFAGDTRFVAWLIARMDEPQLARLAGEAFSLITGLDLAYLDLDRSAPEHIDAGPSDNPDDEQVAIDEDDSLPWPDAAKLGDWWKTNGARFDPGQRYFMGQPPNTTHCLSVLKTGFQRQRRHAAEYLCLLKPGTPLFNTAAPAWRQQRLLAQMAGS